MIDPHSPEKQAEAVQDEAKRRAAAAAADFVEQDMKIGLGPGSTANFFIEIIGRRVAEGLKVVAVPTSERSRALAEKWRIPLSTLEETPTLDLTVDGADEFDSRLRLVKGGGGALFREKIVASASRRMIVIADPSKQVKTLGRFPLPIEVEPFGAQATLVHIRKALEACGCAGEIEMRMVSDAPFETDGRNRIFDCALGEIPDPEALADRLKAITGVVEHGLFIGLASAVIVGEAQCARILNATP